MSLFLEVFDGHFLMACIIQQCWRFKYHILDINGIQGYRSFWSHGSFKSSQGRSKYGDLEGRRAAGTSRGSDQVLPSSIRPSKDVLDVVGPPSTGSCLSHTDTPRSGSEVFETHVTHTPPHQNPKYV